MFSGLVYLLSAVIRRLGKKYFGWKTNVSGEKYTQQHILGSYNTVTLALYYYVVKVKQQSITLLEHKCRTFIEITEQIMYKLYSFHVSFYSYSCINLTIKTIILFVFV